MGFLDTVRGLFSRPQSLTAAAEPLRLAAPPTEAEGIPGGANFSGRLLFEPTQELREQSGYGRAGTYEVGQWKQIALSNPFVTAGIDFILAPVAGARLDVEPPPEGSMPTAQAKTVTDFVRWCLTEKYQLERLTDAAARGFLLSGFSLFEPLYEETPCPHVPGRPVWALRDAAQRLPNSLDTNAWLEDEAGRLTGIRQSGPMDMGGQWVRQVLPAERVLLFSWKREANNWAGESQLRSAWYIAGKVMPTLLKMTGVTLQREGAGLPVAVATDKEAKLTPNQRTELVQLFANATFHESMSLIMPAGWDVKWVFSPGANKGHILDAWRDLGLVVLQQLGAQQLALGTGETGSRSVGEVHDARSMAFVRKVLGFVSDVYNGVSGESHTGLVKRLVDFNFGPQAAYPRVKLTAQRPELQPQELGAAVAGFKAAGLLTPTVDDENTVRERLGFAPIDEATRTAAKQAAAALAPKLTPGEPANDDAPPDEKKLAASAQRGAWAPWRPLRASESKLKLTALDAYFTSRREAFESRVRPVVVGMLAMAAPKVASAMADGKVTPGEVADVPLDTARLEKVLRDYIDEVRAAGADFLREELRADKPLTGAAEDEQGDEREDEKRTAEDDADEVTEAQVQAVKRRIVSRQRSELEREAIDALRTGGDAAEVVSRTVSRQLDTGAFRSDAGYVTTKAFNVGREEAARIMGGIASVEYTAILDNATCEACQALDGATAAFDSAEHDRLVPPNRDCAGGDNCRCLLVFVPGKPGEGDE